MPDGRRRLDACTALGSVMAILGAAPAWAQDTAPVPAASATAASAEDTTGDVIVTATRRAQSLQDVPVSVTAIADEQIQREYPRNLADFSKISPNVTIEPVGAVSRSSAVIYSRGIGFGANDAIEPPIAVSIDGLFYAVNVGSLLNTYDVAQIEILKGPQGTLFGRNTTGGVIQIRTNDPTHDASVSGLLRFGSFGRFDANLTANVPITDTLAARVSFNSLKSNGAFVNTFVDPTSGQSSGGHRTGGDDSRAIRVKLKWEPNADFTMKLTGFYTRQAQDAPVGTNASGVNDRLTLRGRPGIGLPGGPTDPFVISRDTDGADDLTQKSAILDLGYTTGAGFDITSITGYLKTNSLQIADFDSSNLNFFTSEIHTGRSQVSQELRLQSSDPKADFQWQGGAFYFTTRWQTRQANVLGPSYFATTEATTPVVSQFLGANTFEESVAAFGQADLRIFDKLVLTAGGRFTHERKSIRVYPSLTGLSGPLPAPLRNADTWDDFTYHLAARYEFSRDLMAYASYSTGKKAGGFSNTATTQSQLDPYEPEGARAWEVGIRSELFDRKLRLNLTGFWNEYSDLQVSAYRPVTGGSGQQSFVANSAFERARGVELEANLEPVHGLHLSSSIGYLDARYTSFVAALSYNFPGHVCNTLTGPPGSPPVEQDHADPASPCFLLPPRTPEWTVRADAAYDLDLGGKGTLTPHLAYSFEDAHFTNLTNAPQGFQPGYSLVNADITYLDPSGRYRASVFVKNLTDETHLLNANPIAGLFTVNYYAEPRVWGLELAVKF